MTVLPDEPQVTIYTTERMVLRLTHSQLEHIVLEWAKSRGFSHHADVTIEDFDGIITTIEETRTK